MSTNVGRICRRANLTWLAIPSLYIGLSACGGGGSSGIASTPPPPPPPTAPPPVNAAAIVQGYNVKGSLDVATIWLDSPATRAGSYGVIGRLSLTPGNGGPSTSRSILPGEFTFAVANASNYKSYSLAAPSGILPGGLTSIGPTSVMASWDINQTIAYRYNNPYGDWAQALGQRLTAYDKASNGTRTELFSYDFTRGTALGITNLSPDRALRTTLIYDIGYSYVAMGEWSWRVVDLNGTAAGDFGDLLFVNGDRTPSSGIPASGTATYDAHSLALLGSNGSPGIPFTLTADFGARTMSALISQDYRYDPARSASADPILGIHVGGSASFTNSGSFDIPLIGTMNYASSNSPTVPSTEPVTGLMNGAFFGPNAEQVGGVFALTRSGGAVLAQDAYVGQRH